MKLACQIFPAVSMALLLSANASATTPSWSYEHPKVTSGQFQIRSACMMPAEGKLSKVGMKGGEGMTKESDAWSTTLQTVVESHLKAAGVQLLPTLGASGSGASDDELNQVLLQLQEKYAGIAAKINRKPKDIGKSRFTLGDDVALLPCSAKADVLVFVEGEGQVLTGGKKTMGVLFGGASASTAALILTMADAKSGEIVAFVRMNNAEKFLSDSEKAYGKALDKQFNKMRIGTTADNGKKH
ncbi:MAG TPA: hypothetical protein VN776_13040 [Terracidiphilus sp.]|nr:hypothetical protein [Terracidiphilus sp.]